MRDLRDDISLPRFPLRASIPKRLVRQPLSRWILCARAIPGAVSCLCGRPSKPVQYDAQVKVPSLCKWVQKKIWPNLKRGVLETTRMRAISPRRRIIAPCVVACTEVLWNNVTLTWTIGFNCDRLRPASSQCTRQSYTYFDWARGHDRRGQGQLLTALFSWVITKWAHSH